MLRKDRLPAALTVYAITQFASWLSYASIFKILLETGSGGTVNLALYAAAVSGVRALASFLAGRGYLARKNHYPLLLLLVNVLSIPQFFAIEYRHTIAFIAISSVKLGLLTAFQVWRDILSGKIARVGVAKTHRINSVITIVDFVALGGGCLLGGILAQVIGPHNAILSDVPFIACALVILLRLRKGLFASMIRVGTLKKLTGWRPLAILSHGVRSIADSGFQAALPIIVYGNHAVSTFHFSLLVTMSAFLIAVGAKMAALAWRSSHMAREKYGVLSLYSTVLNAIFLWLTFAANNIWMLAFWLALASVSAGISVVAGRTIFIAELHSSQQKEFDGALYFTLIRWLGLSAGSLLFAAGISVSSVEVVGASFLLLMAFSGFCFKFAATEGSYKIISVGQKATEVLFATLTLLFLTACGVSYFFLIQQAGQRRLQSQYTALVPYAALVEMNLRISDLSEVIRISHSYRLPTEIQKLELKTKNGDILFERDVLPNYEPPSSKSWHSAHFKVLSNRWSFQRLETFFPRYYCFEYAMPKLGPGGSDAILAMYLDEASGIVHDLELTLGIITVFLIFFVFVFVLLSHIFHQLLKPLSDVSKYLNSMIQHSQLQDLALCPEQLAGSSVEVYQVIRGYNNLLTRTTELNQELGKTETERKLNQLASQVAHDIRSPLAALSVFLGRASSLSEDRRVMARNAVQRIQDIANNLIAFNRVGHKETDGETMPTEPLSDQLLSGLIESLITEKRMQFRDRLGVDIVYELSPESYGLFGRIQPNEFKRVLSNLINNSVEALSETGQVRLTLRPDEHGIRLEIIDTGGGISPEVLPLLMRRGVSHGKLEGNGLGLFHAKSTLVSWGGDLAIKSNLGEGTRVIVTLQKAEPPSWFVPVIRFFRKTKIVVIDDDCSIHDIWQGRFKLEFPASEDLSITHFSIPEDVEKWFDRHTKEERDSMIFLCDFEFLNQKITGLDLISRLQIEKQSILVTSRFEDPLIRQRCELLGIRFVPKCLAGFVPIQMEISKFNVTPTDAILIDDDALARSCWQLKARENGKHLECFSTLNDFMKVAEKYDRKTPIYVDSNLGNGIRGEIAARDIFALGFKEIRLATGYDARDFPNMDWICAIVDKEPPWA
ncbi:MAG: hypothetical protein C5B49_14650 [Bdellovibrio sp.]|nr:MAG: hypothetical protein C5B49_14650 [Bdellovibrio sp.]